MYKKYPVDKFLYHFTKVETAKNDILPYQQLKFSSYDKTNDPYETKNWSISIKDSLEEIKKVNGENKKLTLELIMDFNEKRNKYINSIKSKVHTLCFSEDDKNFKSDNLVSYFGLKKGWGYPRMWHQYGDKHKGVCLMIDKDILVESIKKEFADNFHIYKGMVSYTDELTNKVSNQIDLKEVMLNGISKSITNKIYCNIEGLFFRKALDWCSEREFRYILVPKSANKREPIYASIANALKVIVLGSEIKPRYEKEIEQIAKEFKICLYKVNWDFSIPMIYNAPYNSWCNNIPNPFVFERM
jgi:hypothetical protein